MNIDGRIACLKEIDLFESFAGEELMRFAENVKEVSLDTGEVLFYEGAPASDMFVLVKGCIKVFKESRTITQIKAVDYIGEMSIIETKPRSATVQATEPSLLLQITYEQFQDYLARQPTSLVSMMRTLSRRIRRDTEIIAGEFEKANIMIHDMKNIITPFLFLEPLMNKIEDVAAQRHLRFMHNAHTNLAEMMEQALANAKRLYRPPPLFMGSLRDLIIELHESDLQIHPDLMDKRIQLSLDETVPDLSFCKLDIRRVLANLINNAGQASEPGGTIDIALKRNGNQAEVHIRDYGCGIPDKYKDKIFHSHFTTKDQGGNGLGLTSCRQIVVNRHGGSLWFQSRQGEGALFAFSLPLSRDP